MDEFVRMNVPRAMTARSFDRPSRMRRKHKVAFVTIVPSPYQRDLFGALAAREEIDLSVFYLESAAPDSPWPDKDLRTFERILPGFWFNVGRVRAHMNWPIPDLSDADF